MTKREVLAALQSSPDEAVARVLPETDDEGTVYINIVDDDYLPGIRIIKLTDKPRPWPYRTIPEGIADGHVRSHKTVATARKKARWLAEYFNVRVVDETGEPSAPASVNGG